jgi:hypothetical protein
VLATGSVVSWCLYDGPPNHNVPRRLPRRWNGVGAASGRRKAQKPTTTLRIDMPLQQSMARAVDVRHRSSAPTGSNNRKMGTEGRRGSKAI